MSIPATTAFPTRLRGATAMPAATPITITAARARRLLPPNLEVDRIVGLDASEDHRIVVDDFDAVAKATADPGVAFRDAPFVFALTACCNASDKGVEDGIVCRGCYGYDEVGDYMHWLGPEQGFSGVYSGRLLVLDGIRTAAAALDLGRLADLISSEAVGDTYAHVENRVATIGVTLPGTATILERLAARTHIITAYTTALR